MKMMEYAVKNKSVVIFFTILITIWGLISYSRLGKLEDPEFKIKEALVVTLYPGGMPHEVELEVTDKIENALKQMPDIEYTESTSKYGYSEVKVKLKESIPSKNIQQYWDVLRRKVADVQLTLPLGTIPSIVLDDYGDVYGMFFAVTNEGYKKIDFNKYINYIKREFQNLDGVSKVAVFGKQTETINIVLDRAKMSDLKINDKMILASFISQNIPAASTYITEGDIRIPVNVDRQFYSVEDIENIVIFSIKDPLGIADEVIRIKDIAKVSRDVTTPVSSKMRYNGKEAVGIQLSPSSGSNVLNTGKEIEKKITEIKSRLPVGINLEKIYYQPDQVATSIDQFMINLIESVLVVIGVLLVTLGMRSGLIIGSTLVLSILGTFIFLPYLGVDIQRVSLGSFIVAMGMLVDNSIVVVDAVLTALDNGDTMKEAMIKPTSKVALPLFGATFVAIIAFLPVYMMKTYIGEYIKSLFYIIAISLTLSWIFAITQTLVFCGMFLKSTNGDKKENKFAEKIYAFFKGSVIKLLHFRKVSLLLILVITTISVGAFLFIPKSFFPMTNKNGFLVNVWLPENTKLDKTDEIAKKLEDYISKDKRVVNVSSTIGASPSRYYIALLPEEPNTAFAQIIVDLKSYKDINSIGNEILAYAKENIPEVSLSIRKYPNGVSTSYPVEIRVLGPDPAMLRNIGNDLKDIIKSSKYASNIKTDWKRRVIVWEPKYDQVTAKKNLVSLKDIGAGLDRATVGHHLGNLKDGDESLDILMREDKKENEFDLSSFGDIPVWGIVGISPIQLKEVISSYDLKWIDPVIVRRNGIRALKVQYDIPLDVDPELARSNIKKAVSKYQVPEGYELQWAGEYFEMVKNVKEVGINMPLQLLLMFSGCVLLFKNLKEPILIFVILPLCFIGITIGLLITGKNFGLISLIGIVSLTGMMIKNSIVLLDQINYEKTMLKKTAYAAIISSVVNRVRPVSLAAGTTILGMLPLLSDPLYGDMAATIVFGLTASTILTLVVLPLFYAIAYKVPNDE